MVYLSKALNSRTVLVVLGGINCNLSLYSIIKLRII